MNEKNNVDNNENIDIGKIINTMWKNKITIIVITTIITILAIIYSVLFIDTVYTTEQTIAINMPETISTKYGDYKPLFTTNQQYINLICSNNVLVQTMKDVNINTNKISIDDFTKKIQIKNDLSEPNTFDITIKANSKELTHNIANSIYKNYISYITKTLEVNCINNFINTYETKIELLQSSIATNEKLLLEYEKLLNSIPKSLSLNELLNGTNVDNIIIESNINDNYVKVESDIIILKQSIASAKYNIESNSTIIKELKEDLESIDNENYNSNFSSLIKSNIVIASEAVYPNQRISPNIALNAFIFFFIGLILSTIYVLLKNTLIKNSN